MAVRPKAGAAAKNRPYDASGETCREATRYDSSAVLEHFSKRISEWKSVGGSILYWYYPKMLWFMMIIAAS